MRHASGVLVVAAVMMAVAATAASAQPAAAVGTIPAASYKAAEMWNANPVGIYDVTLTTAERAVYARITISNTGDKLVALFWPKGDEEGQKMEVTVAETQLVLTARTAKGPMEVSIEHQGQKLTGSWILGNQRGSLKGEVAR